MKREPMGPVLGPWFKGMGETPPDAQLAAHEVMARLPEVSQRGRWWPLPVFDRPAPIPATNGPTPARGFTMFSAVKFLVAGVVVALFSGALLAGVLTAPEGEVPPAAPMATVSPEPDSTPPPSATPVPDATTQPVAIPARVSELGLQAREIEPGVLLLGPKGGGDAAALTELLPTIIGLDGSWWDFRYDDDDVRDGEEFAVLSRSGERRPVPWKRYWVAYDGDIAVGPDGMAWARLDKGVISYDGTSWTIHHRIEPEDRWTGTVTDGEVGNFEGSIFAELEVGPDGSAWVARVDGGVGEVEVLRFDGGEWRSMGAFPAVPVGANPDTHLPMIHLSASRDETWLATSNPLALHRFHDGAWTEVTLPDGLDPILDGERVVSNILGLQAGRGGTLWLHTMRPGGFGQLGLDYYDGAEWSGWHSVFFEDEMARRETEPAWRPPWTPNLFAGVDALAPDGGLWLRGNEGWDACDGLYRVVGTMVTHHFLPDRCVEEIRVMPDGDVWFTAAQRTYARPGARAKLFVIPAETLATIGASPS